MEDNREKPLPPLQSVRRVPPLPPLASPVYEKLEKATEEIPPSETPVPTGYDNVPLDLLPPPPAQPKEPVLVPTINTKSKVGSFGKPVVFAGVLLGSVCISAMMGGYIGFLMGEGKSNGVSPQISTQMITGVSNSADGVGLKNMDVSDIAALVSPAVVRIDIDSPVNGPISGSGFIIRKDGYIVTNAHVAGEAQVEGKPNVPINILLNNGEETTAELVGISKDYDLAVLKIDKQNLPTVAWGNSDSLKVGEPVVALGSPLGLEGTVTSGIVSSLNRPVTTGGETGVDDISFINAVQTDAAINPGNSGGPLVDSAASVVGVNSAIASMPDSVGNPVGSIGLGFAIPSNTAKRVVQELIEKGSSQTPVIGVTIDQNYDGSGVKVKGVTVGGPADKAGIKAGDVIDKIEGKRIVDPTVLIVMVREKKVGDSIKVGVLRDGLVKEYSVILAPAD